MIRHTLPVALTEHGQTGLSLSLIEAAVGHIVASIDGHTPTSPEGWQQSAILRRNSGELPERSTRNQKSSGLVGELKHPTESSASSKESRVADADMLNGEPHIEGERNDGRGEGSKPPRSPIEEEQLALLRQLAAAKEDEEVSSLHPCISTLSFSSIHE